MLGEQKTSTNADNYWVGWESIRIYLLNNFNKLKEWGWTFKKINIDLFGCTEKSGGMVSHYIGKSQWEFPTKENYLKLQKAAKGKAFKKEYDELKKEWLSKRAYFDNTHDLMTDVWDYKKVIGKHRWSHPTPKPVEMIERIMKTSAREGDLVYSPFLGSGTDLIACHYTNRILYGCEIEPKWVEVILQRYYLATGKQPELLLNIYDNDLLISEKDL
jgi:hypothetical protein